MLDALVSLLITLPDPGRELAVARPSRSVSAVRDASRVPARWARFAACRSTCGSRATG